MKWIEAILGSTLLATIAGILGQWWLKHRKKKGLELYVDDSLEIIEAMNEAMIEKGAVRLLVLKTTNGGGIPKVGKEVYSSVLYEVYGPGQDPVKRKWQQQIIDQQYTKMLGQVISEGTWESHTEDMERGMLKDIYQTNGVGYSRVHFLCRTKRAVYYLSSTWVEEEVELANTPETRDAGRICVNIIRPKFRN